MTKVNTKASSVSEGLFVEVEKLERNDELYKMALSETAEAVLRENGGIGFYQAANEAAARMTPGILCLANDMKKDIKNPEELEHVLDASHDIDVYDSDGFYEKTLFQAYSDNWDYASDAAEALSGGRKKLTNGYTLRLGRGSGKIGIGMAIFGIGMLAFAGIGYAAQNIGKDNANSEPVVVHNNPVNTPVMEKIEKIEKIDKVTDSDSDGLSDWNELNVYHSNPAKPDTDGDYITDGKEVQLGTNPTKMYTYGNVLDDFNREFVYCPHEVNCNNADRDSSFLAKIPNVEAKGFMGKEGILNYTPDYQYDELAPKIVNISLRDPLIEYYAKRMEIIFPKGNEPGKILVDGESIFKEYGFQDFYSPSYYFTHGRKEVCSGVALATATLLKMNGNEVHLFEAIRNGGSHAYIEAKIGGKDYGIDFEQIFEKKRFYQLNNNMTNIKKIF